MLVILLLLSLCVLVSYDVTQTVSVCVGQFNQNGYWADHWTYTLDLLDSYLAIFPDAEEAFLYEPDSIAFFMSPAFVRARINRYTLIQDPNKPGGSLVRSYR